MPNVMVALPNIGGALCSTPQSLLTPTTRVPCSNAAKTRNPLQFTGVPLTRQRISAASGPKFTILLEHVEEVLLLNKFFFRLSIHALVAKIWPDTIVRCCRDGDFFASCISSEPRAAHFRPAFYIFVTKARVDNRKKNLLSSNTSWTCSRNMANFGLLAAAICWRV